jgi:hypothetical protein
MTTLTVVRNNNDNAATSDITRQPDTLLIYDYFESFRRKNPLEPEKQLMEAILADAVNVFRLYAFADSTEKKKLFWEARRWIWTDDWYWPFSFRNACEVLSLNPGYLRQRLIHWKDRQPRRALGHNRTVSIEQQTS